MEFNLNEITDLTDPQIRVIKAICTHQLDSLKRLIADEALCNEDLTLFLIQNEVTREELNEKLHEQITLFSELYNNPDDLRVLDQQELSMFRHLLSNIEQEWADKFPNAIRNLWQRLHIIEECQGNIYTAQQMN